MAIAFHRTDRTPCGSPLLLVSAKKGNVVNPQHAHTFYIYISMTGCDARLMDGQDCVWCWLVFFRLMCVCECVCVSVEENSFGFVVVVVVGAAVEDITHPVILFMAVSLLWPNVPAASAIDVFYTYLLDNTIWKETHTYPCRSYVLF